MWLLFWIISNIKILLLDEDTLFWGTPSHIEDVLEFLQFGLKTVFRVFFFMVKKCLRRPTWQFWQRLNSSSRVGSSQSSVKIGSITRITKPSETKYECWIWKGIFLKGKSLINILFTKWSSSEIQSINSCYFVKLKVVAPDDNEIKAYMISFI